MADQATTTVTATNNTNTPSPAAAPVSASSAPGQTAPPVTAPATAVPAPAPAASTDAAAKPADAATAVTLNPLAAALEQAQKQEGQTQDKDKKDDTTKAAESVPEKYEFKAPEGVTLHEKTIEQFSAVAKELKLSQAAAQKLVDFDVAREKARAAEIQTFVTDGAKALAADQNPGERNQYATKAFLAAKKGLSADDAAAVQNLIFGNNSFLGNHPGFVRFLANMGKLVSEDRPVEVAAKSQPREITWAEKHYGKR